MKRISKPLILFSAPLLLFSLFCLRAADHLPFAAPPREYSLQFIGAWVGAALSSMALILIPLAVVLHFKDLGLKAFAVLSAAISLVISFWLWKNFIYAAEPDQTVFGCIIKDKAVLYAVSVFLHLLYAAAITAASLLFYQPVRVLVEENKKFPLDS